MIIQTYKLKQHPSLLTHTDIANICQPFFKKFSYSYFTFIRLYNDGRISYLCDNHAWLQHYLTIGFPSIGAFEQNSDCYQQKFILWDALNDDDPIIIFGRNMFNIKHGITLVYQFTDGKDFFNFGRSDDDRIIQETMIQQLAELESFTQLFYDKAEKLIDKVQQQPFTLSQFNYHPEQISKCNRLYLGPQYNYSYLTQKEITYLKELISGKTIPDIAGRLHVSPRTIEKHIENIKEKLHCHTQFELGYTAAKLDFSN